MSTCNFHFVIKTGAATQARTRRGAPRAELHDHSIHSTPWPLAAPAPSWLQISRIPSRKKLAQRCCSVINLVISLVCLVLAVVPNQGAKILAVSTLVAHPGPAQGIQGIIVCPARHPPRSSILRISLAAAQDTAVSTQNISAGIRYL